VKQNIEKGIWITCNGIWVLDMEYVYKAKGKDEVYPYGGRIVWICR
jgi:ribulose 1,5-bisphosphate carboxylase large subunit-like protein